MFVHGLSGSWTNWMEQLPIFAQERRVIAMDLPGFGFSPMPRERISISGYARILDGLFTALGLDGGAVVGNSMGGFVWPSSLSAFPSGWRGWRWSHLRGSAALKSRGRCAPRR